MALTPDGEEFMDYARDILRRIDKIEQSYCDGSHKKPKLSISKVFCDEFPDKVNQRIFVFERVGQFDLLSENPKTFMWVSLTSQQILDRYNLVQRVWEENKKVYRDVFIYHKGYKLTKLDKDFITSLITWRISINQSLRNAVLVRRCVRTNPLSAVGGRARTPARSSRGLIPC